MFNVEELRYLQNLGAFKKLQMGDFYLHFRFKLLKI